MANGDSYRYNPEPGATEVASKIGGVASNVMDSILGKVATGEPASPFGRSAFEPYEPSGGMTSPSAPPIPSLEGGVRYPGSVPGEPHDIGPNLLYPPAVS